MKALKKSHLKYLSLVFTCLISFSCTKICLYPLARAFGGPKESELKVIRKSFIRMKHDLSNSRLAIYPACMINFESHEWTSGSAEQIVEFCRTQAEFEAYAIQANPDVTFMPVKHNQMRFMWERARAYADWVKKERPVPEGEFIMFADFICPPDSDCQRVGGVHVYVTDSEGNISYTTLINSHHGIYQQIQPDSLEDCCDMAMKIFLADLTMDVMDLYPPYGVG